MVLHEGRALRAARTAAGVSLSTLADRTHYSKALLSHLENGRRTVTPAHISAYEHALGVRVASEVRTVEAADVGILTQVTDVLTSLGLRYGGTATAEAARSHWEWATDLLAHPMPDDVRTSLSAEAARLADRVAWSLAETGKASKARQRFQDALQLSDGLRDISPVVHVNMANYLTDTGAPDQALTLLEPMVSLSPALSFRAHSARARALATLGEREQAVRYIGRADEAHSRVVLSELPAHHRPYVSGHEAHADADAGKALFILAVQGQRRVVPAAVDRLERAVSLFGPDRARAAAKCQQRLGALVG